MIFIENLDTLPPLHHAAYTGDEGTLKASIDSGSGVDSRANTAQDYGRFFHDVTPLMVAAGSPNNTLSAMHLLLKLGADPLAKSAGEVAALWYAASSGDEARVQLLLEAGNDPNEIASNGRSVIGEAAGAGVPDCIHTLLKAGASPHPFGNANGYATANHYQIPLFRAAQSGNAACVEALLIAGTPATARDDSERTALAYATSTEVVSLLLKAGCPLNIEDQLGWTALDVALQNHQADVVRALIAAGATLDARNSGLRIPPLARFCGSLEVDATMVQVLIDVGANVYAHWYHERTALHEAVGLITGDRRGKLGDVVRVLVKAGIPVDVRDEGGNTPLHIAVGDEGTDESAVEALLDLGADVNASNNQSKTPLMMAVDSGFYGRVIVPLLIARGADVRQASVAGTTVREYALKRVQLWEDITTTREQQEEQAVWSQHALEEARNTLKIIDDALGK